MKKFALAFIISVLCAALCACGFVSRIDLGAVADEEATPSPVPMSGVSALDDQIEVKNTSALRVGFSAGFANAELQAAGVAGFAEYCEAAGVAYEVREAADANQQAEDIAAFVAEGFDAIALSPIDASAEAAVAHAVAAGIPVVSITELAGADIVIEPGDYDFSVITAQKLLKLSGARIAILDSTDESPRMQKRRDAYEFVTDAAGAVVLANEAAGSIEQASEIAARLMEENPQLGGILCVDTNGLVGAAQALPEGSRIAVGGAEVDAQVLSLMEAGRIKVAAAQFARKQGSLAAEAALGLALGEYYPPEITATSKVYTAFDWQDAAYELQGLEPPEE